MATGVKPRDDIQFSKTDIETIGEALKDANFRKLLSEYCEEVTNPENQALYQKEMTQLEKERGVDITFINPIAGYVIKTSVAGEIKAFVNICSNENVKKPSYVKKIVDGRSGLDWSIPYSLIPPRDDYDKKKSRCVVYDIVFHPDTLRIAEKNKLFKDLVNTTAFDALEDAHNIQLDRKNYRLIKLNYKGYGAPAVIRTPDPNFKPNVEERESPTDDILEKLYPQKNLSEPITEIPKARNIKYESKAERNRNPYTTPKYVIKQQKNIDIQNYTNEKNSRSDSAIPSHIVVEINLPMISSTADCNLDIKDKFLHLVCDKGAHYKLDLVLPYSVNDDMGTAKFFKAKHLLVVTLPVINIHKENFLKIDSGVESEENSYSNSDEDPSDVCITVLKCESVKELDVKPNPEDESFLNSELSYCLPSYTHNVMDNIVAFTFHVKNTDPESCVIKTISPNILHLKFNSIGSGYVPVHYAAYIKFEDNIVCENPTVDAWDNNIIMQIEFNENTPESCQIGLDEVKLELIKFEMNLSDHSNENEQAQSKAVVEDCVEAPIVEVSSRGLETNITLTSSDSSCKYDNDDDDDDDDEEGKDDTKEERAIVWTGIARNTKGILRKSTSSGRSFSESSVGDIPSSVDYISSDYVPEESSLKKTVRFSDAIARQFYRYNSSIEGQKKKNQRKKIKKRNLERRKSESEAEDNPSNEENHPRNDNISASLEKVRSDSGISELSDNETTVKKNKKKSKPKALTADNIKHNTQMYDPDKLDKGQYLEVNFKNELIFDLDM